MLKYEVLYTNPETEALTQRLNIRIGDFDILALLRLLKFKGYPERHIRFESHETLTSQERLIERVQLYEKHVLITLNMGLLGIQTPLPMAILDSVAEDTINADKRTNRLLKLLDHTLILNYLASIYPEYNTGFFSQWHETRQNLLLIQSTHSTAFLYWLFQRIFPEFYITFSKKKIPRIMATEAITLNQFHLGGGATIGGLANINEQCIHINLDLDLDHYRFHISWLHEVEDRFNTFIYPLLNKHEICLFISLKLAHDGGFRLLHDSRLGRDLLSGNNTTSATPQLQTYILHQGAIRFSTKKKTQTIQWGETCRIRI